MKTSEIIKGMQILQKYYLPDNDYNTGAEHDIIYMYMTDAPVSEEDVAELRELGWFQHGEGEYDQSEPWCAYV